MKPAVSSLTPRQLVAEDACLSLGLVVLMRIVRRQDGRFIPNHPARQPARAYRERRREIREHMRATGWTD